MAKIIGNIEASDDYTHPLGSEENFNESMYFNFFDASRQAGGPKYARKNAPHCFRCRRQKTPSLPPGGRKPPYAANLRWPAEAGQARAFRWPVLTRVKARVVAKPISENTVSTANKCS